MSYWTKLYNNLLSIPLSTLVKSKSVPSDPVLELGLDISCPIIYVLPYKSKVDLLILRTYSLNNNLPDPLEPLIINDIKFPRCIFIQDNIQVFTCYISKDESVKIFHDYLDLHRTNPALNVQVILVSVTFCFNRKHKKRNMNSLLHVIFNSIQKIFVIACFGRNSFLHFSHSISLREIISKRGIDKFTGQKLIRMARIYFIRQRLMIIGPQLPSRQHLLNKLLKSKTIVSLIEEEINNRKISYKEAQHNVFLLMKEIVANFSYKIVYFTDCILHLMWNYLYQGINIHNIERVRQLAYKGHEIIYIPCHRSHMDYLLLSYVLYHQGLMLPHIAAGINLNFWPIGYIFRRLGAFFIRRTFKGNRFYFTVFREYLEELLNAGCSVEYFIEGGRSRTGRLLDPKTGILSVTIQAVLKDTNRPVTLVPIYIGYEHVIEVGTYTKELYGATKKKDSLFQVLLGISKLRNLGESYVNFGEPLSIMDWLNQHIPEWRYELVNSIKIIRPIWLTSVVNSIAIDLMVRINNAGALNAVNLCCTALLSSRFFLLTRRQLTQQLECYLDLMRNVPYAKYSTVPSVTVSELIDHALQMNKFKVERNSLGDSIIILPYKQIMPMTYYRNNIIHMLVLPALVATILTQYRRILRLKLLQYIKILYPILKAELFLHWDNDELIIELNKITDELLRQKLIKSEYDELFINWSRLYTLQLLAATICGILQRYAITFWLLILYPSISHNMLKKTSYELSQRLSTLYGINEVEFSDITIFNTLVATLHNEGYINNNGNNNSKLIRKVYKILAELITPDVRLFIESINEQKNFIK